MGNITDTMRVRARLVTHSEAAEAVDRLIRSHGARTSIPARVTDDDIVASDYLVQQAMSDEEKVLFLCPTAALVSGPQGRIWIAKDRRVLIGNIYQSDPVSHRAEAAWKSALRELCNG